jgi:hypothetical protein
MLFYADIQLVRKNIKSNEFPFTIWIKITRKIFPLDKFKFTEIVSVIMEGQTVFFYSPSF